MCAAGTFDLATTARLLKRRGQAMQAAVPVGQGAMAALLGADLAIAQAVAEAAAQGEICAVANDNDPSQVVISGHKGAVERALDIAKEKGARRAILLPVSAPFHCPLMQPAAEIMAEALAGAAMAAPAVPLYANVTAAPVDDADAIRDLLVRAGDRHGPLARERRGDDASRRHPFRRVRRQGARPDGQAHRARRERDQRRFDGRHRRAGEGSLGLFARRRGGAEMERLKDIEEISGDVLDVSLRLHRQLGPGLLESVYETILAAKLAEMGYRVLRQQPIGIEFEGLRFEAAFRIDLLVDQRLLVEIKCVDQLHAAHAKQLLTYLRLTGQPVGLLINFAGATLKEGFRRIVNDYKPSASPRLRVNLPPAGMN